METNNCNNNPIVKTGRSGRNWTLGPDDFELTLSNGHGSVLYNFEDGIWIVDDAGIPSEAWNTDEELYRRDLYVGNILPRERVEEIDPRKIKYFRTLADFDAGNGLDVRVALSQDRKITVSVPA